MSKVTMGIGIALVAVSPFVAHFYWWSLGRLGWLDLVSGMVALLVLLGVALGGCAIVANEVNRD